jgi:4'-phosphopantetheinyl transferase
MDLCWLEQAAADVPEADDWLGANERARLNGLRIPKRRAEWRLGRWTAKRAVAGCLGMPSLVPMLARIEIRAAPDGAPEVFLAERPAALTISLSHREGIGVCAVAPAGAALGCDLEVIERRSDGFLSDFFTAEEQALADRAAPLDRPQLVTLLWSAKESALKALREGLRLDTRSVVVGPVDALQPCCIPNRWSALRVRCQTGQVFQGWWQHTDNLVRTVVAAPPPFPPILIERVCRKLQADAASPRGQTAAQFAPG